MLTGTEVKSLRDGPATLRQADVDVRDGEAWLLDTSISTSTREHRRPRARAPAQAAARRAGLEALVGKVRERGFTLVPTRLYFRTAA